MLENKAYLSGRKLNSAILAYFDFNHQFVLITGKEEQLEGYIKEYNISNNLSEIVKPIEIKESMVANGIEKTEKDTHYIILGGYKGGNHTNAKQDGSEEDLLIKDFNSPDDNNHIVKGDFYNTEIEFKNKDEDRNNRDLIESYLSYDNSANYPGTGVPNNDYYTAITGIKLRKPEALQTYNSNSFAYTICSNGGGKNCDYDFKGDAPGYWKLIPEKYFNYKKY